MYKSQLSLTKSQLNNVLSNPEQQLNKQRQIRPSHASQRLSILELAIRAIRVKCLLSACYVAAVF